MRFNDEQHLINAIEKGQYPVIHDDIFTCIEKEKQPTDRMVDVGCSTGLLAHRIKRSGNYCFGFDADKAAMAQAKKYNTGIEIVLLKIEGEFSIDRLIDEITLRGVNSVVARRVLSELFPYKLALGEYFAMKCHQAGIRNFYVQGRQLVPKPTNPLWCIEKEVELLTTYYDLQYINGQVAYLTRK